MILKLAWRNIWRNKRRTWILIAAVAIAYFGMFFFLTVTEGAIQQVIQNIIDSGVGHIQIHRKGYLEDPEVKKFIENPSQILKKLKAFERQIEAYSARVNLQGVIYSPQETSPVQVIGGDLDLEKTLSKLDDYIVDGYYPTSKNEILIGKDLAEILKVNLGDKVVLSCADVTGEIASYAFRVAGIFKSPSKDVNRMLVLVDIRAASEIAGYKNQVNEIVIRLKSDKFTPVVKAELEKMLGEDFEVLSWGEVYPLIKYQFEMFSEFLFIYGLFILMGAVFGIVNVFFMSIYERMREFGILRALGLKPGQLRNLIIAEGFLIAIVAIGVALIPSFALFAYLSVKGLNLSVFSRSLEIWGSGSIIYPALNAGSFIGMTLLIFVVVILSVIFPARKARKIIITEALRYV